MLDWLRSWRRPSRPGTDLAHQLQLLVDELYARVPEPARAVQSEIERYQRLAYAHQVDEVPGIYLLLEQALVRHEQDIDPATMRAATAARFPEVAALDGFAPVLASGAQQKVLVGRRFLLEANSHAVDALGQGADGWFVDLAAWLREVPVSASRGPRTDEPAPPNDAGWLAALQAQSAVLFEALHSRLGDGPSRRMFERAYETTSQRYRALAGFPAVILLLPPELLDPDKIDRLNRAQLRGMLVDQLAELEASHRAIESKNAELRRTHAELAAARDRAEEASQAKSRFLATVSHELRTPLTAIVGYADLITEDEDDDDDDTDSELTEDLHAIRDAAQHLNRLVNDILDLSKIEAGKLELVWGPLDLRRAVLTVASTARPLVLRNDNTFAVVGHEGLGTIEGDDTRFRQILLNLVSNAAKFTRGGEVRVEVREGPERVSIDVIDTGIGMDRDQVNQLFGAFSQVHEASEQQRYGGTGLGLAISRELARMMGGDLEVESRKGEGSRFTVWLPRARITG